METQTPAQEPYEAPAVTDMEEGHPSSVVAIQQQTPVS
jgi:hypothetical protein